MNAYPEAYEVAEAARDYFASVDVPEEERFTLDVQSTIQLIAFGREQEAIASGRPVAFSDRSVLDAPAYLLAEGDEQGVARLMTRAVPWLSAYHVIFLLDPADIPFAKDSVRQEEESARTRFHQGFLDLYKRYRIPYVLLSGTPEQRVEAVKVALG